MMITSIKFLFIFGLLLLATSSLTFGNAKLRDEHAAAAATGATTTGLRKTVRKLRSEKSSTNGALMEQSYGFSQTKAKVLLSLIHI